MNAGNVADIVREEKITTTIPVNLRDLATNLAIIYLSLRDKRDQKPELVQTPDSQINGRASRTGYVFTINDLPIFEIYGAQGVFSTETLQTSFVVKPGNGISNQISLDVAISKVIAKYNPIID